jgi:hypothetical protein
LKQRKENENDDHICRHNITPFHRVPAVKTKNSHKTNTINIALAKKSLLHNEANSTVEKIPVIETSFVRVK